jgi:hypothetical protein
VSASPQSADGSELSTLCPWELHLTERSGAVGKCGSHEDFATRHRLESSTHRPFGAIVAAPVFNGYDLGTTSLAVDSMWMSMYESIQRSKRHNKSL